MHVRRQGTILRKARDKDCWPPPNIFVRDPWIRVFHCELLRDQLDRYDQNAATLMAAAVAHIKVLV